MRVLIKKSKAVGYVSKKPYSKEIKLKLKREFLSTTLFLKYLDS